MHGFFAIFLGATYAYSYWARGTFGAEFVLVGSCFTAGGLAVGLPGAELEAKTVFLVASMGRSLHH